MTALVFLLLMATGISVVSSKTFAVERMVSGLYKYKEVYPLPKLPYKYNALEPYIDERTLRIHHEEIFAERTLKMNYHLKKWRESGLDTQLAKKGLLGVMSNIDKVAPQFREKLRNAVGGYLNHIFYFSVLSPNPTGETKNLSMTMKGVITRSFFNLTNLQKKINDSANEIFSNGYVFLLRVPRYKYLTVYVGMQETNPLNVNMQPLLALDLWEHAYFIKYGYNRDEYIRNWWHLVDWDKVEDVLNWWWSFDPKHDEL